MDLSNQSTFTGLEVLIFDLPVPVDIKLAADSRPTFSHQQLATEGLKVLNNTRLDLELHRLLYQTDCTHLLL